MSDQQTFQPEVFKVVTDRAGEKDQVKEAAVDYAERKRSFEWRQNWFYGHRSRDDRALLGTLTGGLRAKKALIEEQRGLADHMAAYGPAGAGTPWYTIGPRNVNGRVKALAVHPTDPNTLYAGAASGGVWKSTDAGQSWRPLWDGQDTLSIGAIAIAPSLPSTLYAGTGEWTPGWGPSFPGTGLFSSIDSGDHWVQHTTIASRRIAQVVVSPTDPLRVYVAGQAGVELSIDGGGTWTTLRAGEASDLVLDPAAPDTLYANFRNDGIYKTVNAGGLWTIQGGGAPTGVDADWVRLAIGVSGAHGSQLVLAKRSGTIYRTTDGGTSWSTLAGSHGAASYHAWCNLVAVAPDDEGVILAGAVGIERTGDGGTLWTSPAGLHSDHHRAVFAPSSPAVVYSCNDGGVYRSADHGATFVKVSDGLIVTQFYDLGSWSAISSVVGGGTQDNGTNMTTGGLTWKKILGGDGGYMVEHPTDPRTIYAESQNTNIQKSVDGGTTWVNKTSGITGSGPFVGVMTMDVNAPNTLFCGTQQVFRTTDGCATPWAASSQSLSGTVSGITVAESDGTRVYAVTDTGHVYRSDDAGATSPWADKTAAPLPARICTDVVVDPSDKQRVAVSFGGTGTGHVFLSTTGGNAWANASGNLPDVPVNALALHPTDPNTLYAGTDVGVFRSIDAGATWQAFDNGIPNVIVTDLQIDATTLTLTAATLGRGMYRVGLSVAAPTVDLYLRDSLLDTGQRFPSPSGQPNPNDSLDDVFWWESADIKVDSLPYYTPDALFDGVDFDGLTHEDPQRTEVNRFYLQVHNRGWQNTTAVSVRAFLADASAGLPLLPNALVPPAFNLTSTVNWMPIGAAQTIPLLEPNRPVIVWWDFSVPAGQATHSCLMAVVSSADDPMVNPETSPGLLVPNEKRVCLKNLHVVDSSAPMQTMETIQFHNQLHHDSLIDIVIVPSEFAAGSIGLMLEPIEVADPQKALDGVGIYAVREGEDVGTFYDNSAGRAGVDFGPVLQKLDRSRIFEFDAGRVSALRGVKVPKGAVLQGVLTFKGTKNVPYGQTQGFTVVQQQEGRTVGGGTYELRVKRARGLLPVSHLRIVLEKVQILDDHDPWLRGAGELRFNATVGFNGEACREHRHRVPQRGHLEISDAPGKNVRQVDACIFDGYVAESDRLSFSIQPVEEDWPDHDDLLQRYTRAFSGPPETWVGQYRPGDEPADPEQRHDWKVWYRIESVPF
jgi:photosystem II stability/assembly factor-like uncharacterized protein